MAERPIKRPPRSYVKQRRKRPTLGLAVWEMRGPIPKILGDAYRDVVDLVTLESYLKDKDDYWFAAVQVQSARIHGVLPKTIVALGIGKGGNPGEEWARTKEELEQQIRFVRMIAPEAPGIGFYSGGDWPELVTKADELSSRYADLPTDGAKLPADVAARASFSPLATTSRCSCARRLWWSRTVARRTRANWWSRKRCGPTC